MSSKMSQTVQSVDVIVEEFTNLITHIPKPLPDEQPHPGILKSLYKVQKICRTYPEIIFQAFTRAMMSRCIHPRGLEVAKAMEHNDLLRGPQGLFDYFRTELGSTRQIRDRATTKKFRSAVEKLECMPFVDRSELFSMAPVGLPPAEKHPVETGIPGVCIRYLSMISLEWWVTVRLVCKEFLVRSAPYLHLFLSRAQLIGHTAPGISSRRFRIEPVFALVDSTRYIRAPIPLELPGMPDYVELYAGSARAKFRDTTSVDFGVHKRVDEYNALFDSGYRGDAAGYPACVSRHKPNIRNIARNFYGGLTRTSLSGEVDVIRSEPWFKGHDPRDFIAALDYDHQKQDAEVKRACQAIQKYMSSLSDGKYSRYFPMVQKLVDSFLDVGVHCLNPNKNLIFDKPVTFRKLKNCVNIYHTHLTFVLAKPRHFCKVMRWLTDTNLNHICYAHSGVSSLSINQYLKFNLIACDTWTQTSPFEWSRESDDNGWQQTTRWSE